MLKVFIVVAWEVIKFQGVEVAVVVEVPFITAEAHLPWESEQLVADGSKH